MRSSQRGVSEAVLLGSRIAEVISGSWRSDPVPLRAPDATEDLVDLLLRSGCAALASVRLTEVPALRDARRMSILRRVIRESRAADAARFMDARGIEALVFKGAVAAADYADPGLRPYGDVDVAVGPAEFERARRLVAEGAIAVDLHRVAAGARTGGTLVKNTDEFVEASDIGWETLRGESRRVHVGGVTMMAPSAEHHLRIVALHFLRHSGYRPMWLVDVAAVVEKGGLDWGRVACGDPWRTRGVRAVVRLAHELLGADLSAAPPAFRRAPLPRWLSRSILREWGSPHRWPQDRVLVSDAVRRRPASVGRELRRRWPGEVGASVNHRAPFNDFPRWPFQLMEAVRLMPRVVRRASQERRRRAAEGAAGRETEGERA